MLLHQIKDKVSVWSFSFSFVPLLCLRIFLSNQIYFGLFINFHSISLTLPVARFRKLFFKKEVIKSYPSMRLYVLISHINIFILFILRDTRGIWWYVVGHTEYIVNTYKFISSLFVGVIILMIRREIGDKKWFKWYYFSREIK